MPKIVFFLSSFPFLTDFNDNMCRGCRGPYLLIRYATEFTVAANENVSFSFKFAVRDIAIESMRSSLSGRLYILCGVAPGEKGSSLYSLDTFNKMCLLFLSRLTIRHTIHPQALSLSRQCWQSATTEHMERGKLRKTDLVEFGNNERSNGSLYLGVSINQISHLH